jgi:hypothetical protein
MLTTSFRLSLSRMPILMYLLLYCWNQAITDIIRNANFFNFEQTDVNACSAAILRVRKIGNERVSMQFYPQACILPTLCMFDHSAGGFCLHTTVQACR